MACSEIKEQDTPLFLSNMVLYSIRIALLIAHIVKVATAHNCGRLSLSFIAVSC